MDLEELKFPIGKYQPPTEIDEPTISEWIDVLEELPNELRELVENLSYEQLDWFYRPNSWKVKQVVHHMADSHMNSFIRFKLVMTEEKPTIRTYVEGKWAETRDANNSEISTSLDILSGVHSRLVKLLKSLESSDFKRKLIHPEFEGELTLGWLVGMYAWHSKHHVAHIKQALEREGDFTSI